MLYIKKQDYEKILAYCRKKLPEEACGLLGGRKYGRDCQVEEVFFLTNMDHSSEHFSMNPREQFTVQKKIRNRTMELVGNFHSHPDIPAGPSEEDQRLAWEREFRYLILSLSEKPELRAFVLEGKELIEEECIMKEIKS